MTTKYWITATGSWELATSWSPAGVPGSADNVVFDTGFTGPGYNNQSSEPTYTVYASTLDADVVNGITVIGDAIRWMGFVATPTLAIENRGYLYVADDALYAGSLTVETGGELAVGGNTQNVNGVYTTEEGLFEDENGLIIGTGTQQASGVLLSGTWMNTDGLVVEGSVADFFLIGGVLEAGSSGIFVTSGATLILGQGTIEGGVTLAGGTLSGDPDVPLGGGIVLDGTTNIFDPVDVVIGPINDGTIPGGFIANPGNFDTISLSARGNFSGGVTIESGTLDLFAAGAAGSGVISFAAGATATLQIEAGALPTKPIEGFASGDTIAFPFIAYGTGLSVSDSAGTVVVANGQTIEALLTFAGAGASLPLSIGIDASGATDLVASGATLYQAAGNSGVWTTPSLWVPQNVPSTSDDVLLSTPGTYTVEISGTQHARSLLDTAGANLAVDANSTLSVANDLSMVGGTLTVLGYLLTNAIAMDGSTLRLGHELESSNGVFDSTNILARGGDIDFVGSTSLHLLLNETGTSPVRLNASGGTGILFADLLQPGGIITSGSVDVYGTTSTVLIQGGTLSDTSSTSAVIFAAGANAELQMAPETGTVTSAVTAAVAPGGGQDTVVAYSGHGSIFAGSGQLTFVGVPSNQEIDPDSSIFPIQPYSAVVVGGAGSLAAYGAASSNLGNLFGTNIFFGGSSGNNVLASGDGASTLVAGGSGDRLYANGTAGVLLVAASGNETLSGLGATGGNLFFGGSGNDLIVAGAGNDTVLAGAGTQTIFGGNTASTAIIAGSGQDLILAGASADYIATGSGVATVFAGAYDIFGVVNGQAGGVMNIFGFSTATDALDLQGFAANTANAVLSTATIAGSNTVLSLPDATKVILFGVTNLGASSFV